MKRNIVFFGEKTGTGNAFFGACTRFFPSCFRKHSAVAAVVVLCAAMAVTCSNCGGGGGGSLPEVPYSLTRDCSKTQPIIKPLDRMANQTSEDIDTALYGTYYPEEANTTVQCLQMWAYWSNMTEADYSNYYYYHQTSINVSAGEEIWFWANLYDYSCYYVTPASSDFKWSIDSSVGTIDQSSINYSMENMTSEDWPYSSRFPIAEVYVTASTSTVSGDITVTYGSHTDVITINVSP